MPYSYNTPLIHTALHQPPLSLAAYLPPRTPYILIALLASHLSNFVPINPAPHSSSNHCEVVTLSSSPSSPACRVFIRPYQVINQ